MPPGEAQQRESLHSQTRACDLCGRDTVAHELRDRADLGAGPRKRKACARLIPLYECEVALPLGEERRQRRIAETGTADDEQRRIGAVGTTQREPL